MVGAVVLLAIPYAVGGASFHADDFNFLRNSHFDGALGAAGSRQVGRPGASLIYDLTFGLIGEHPNAMYVVQVALWAAAAAALLVALRQFTTPSRALAVVLVWLIVPTHTALEHWASTSQALVALVLALLGIRALTTAADRNTSGWLGIAALGAAIATYEATVGLAVLAVVAVPWLRTGGVNRPLLLRGAIGLGIPIVWAVAHPVYVDTTGHLDLELALPGNLSLGLEPFGTAGRLMFAIALAGMLVALLRLVRSTDRASLHYEVLVVAGVAILLMGLAPLVSIRSNFYGMDDRLTVVSGIGAAMIWVGITGMCVERVSRQWAIAVPALGLLAIAVPLRVTSNREWVDSGRLAHAETERLVQLLQQSPHVEVVGPLAGVGYVTGLHDGWNATAAAQLRMNRQDVVIDVLINNELTGP